MRNDIGVKRYFAVGFRGKILQVYDNPICASKHSEKGKHEETPVFEFIPVNMTGDSISVMHEADEASCDAIIAKNLAQAFYDKRDDHGRYGDVIPITRYHLRQSDAFSILCNKGVHLYTAENMYWRAFVKPGLAGDLVLFLRDRWRKTFLILIRRKKDPGAGQIAAPGGFLNVSDFTIETGAECSLREAREEISLESKPLFAHCQISNPRKTEIDITMFIGKFSVYTRLHNLGIYVTEDKENIEAQGTNKFKTKRIYWTFVHTALVQIDEELNEQSAAALFRAADDAKEVIAVPAENIPAIVKELGFNHHKEFIMDAAKLLRII